MKEDLLHFIWKNRLFKPGNLRTTAGEDLLVLEPGLYNRHSGPDFFNARVKIGDVCLAGNVEIHVRGKDWYLHGHDTDEAYRSTILHVVYSEPVDIQISGRALSTLVLEPYVLEDVCVAYVNLMNRPKDFPCSGLISSLPDGVVRGRIMEALEERLRVKSGDIGLILDMNHGDVEAAFIEWLGRAFGFHVNSDPFQMLAKRSFLSVVQLRREGRFVLEALLFGLAGFLDEVYDDEYARRMQQEYFRLRKKMNMNSLPSAVWKFSGTRPHNYPTIRIAQFAALLDNVPDLYKRVTEGTFGSAPEEVLICDVSSYWKRHYHFDRFSDNLKGNMSNGSAATIFSNAIAPFMYFHGTVHSDESLKSRALELLLGFPPEDNYQIRKWNTIGISPKNAAESQGLLQLYKYHCIPRKCLHCSIGKSVLGQHLVNESIGL
jgi:hypothetical protein